MSATFTFLVGLIGWLVLVLIIARAFGINDRKPLPPAGKRTDAPAQDVDQLRKGGAL